jgi:hypothetical protein
LQPRIARAAVTRSEIIGRHIVRRGLSGHTKLLARPGAQIELLAAGRTKRPGGVVRAVQARPTAGRTGHGARGTGGGRAHAGKLRRDVAGRRPPNSGTQGHFQLCIFARRLHPLTVNNRH